MNSFVKFLSKNRELFFQYQDRKIIYLDLNYWIDFIKFENNLVVRKGIPELYKLLLDSIEKKKAITLISDIHLRENFKKKKYNNYSSLIKIFQKLSKNFCIIPMIERELNELNYAVLFAKGKLNDFQERRKSIYTKPIFAYHANFPNFDESENREELEDSYLNFSWEKSLSDIFVNPAIDLGKFQNIEDHEEEVFRILTTGKAENLSDSNSFDELLGKELFGSLDFYTDYITTALRNLGEKEYDVNSETIATRNHIFYILHKEKKFNIFPSVAIGAGIHSLIRWNKPMEYQKSLSFDILHSKVAIPYSDIFLTDGHISSLINNKQLKMINNFNCQVTSDPEIAIELLSHF
ncbi:hypothetical protein EHQ68_06115 [Leptospira congkakensis]|uniref:Uncharacterized protein n=1 Tax=Leptospira congkakensis TaxID=2484932 RepID=A0A4Z1ADV6_9LEPT|nr:hypothetical protein [Leptospira congkakensis]TGL90065.1 hypothetical protein EHQ68_06115 [Leptospira congkakensis]TGL93448.1 hypothetical protein EHQ70_17420 [Leptospira congkakensis]TGL97379.1 hypothetical protein EHQ69_00010 [Leptospira congkakensis]